MRFGVEHLAFVAALALVTASARAQPAGRSAPPDSTAAWSPPDSTKESLRDKVSRLISDQIFVSARVDSSAAGMAVTPADLHLRGHQGRIVRDIRTVRVGVFEYYDGSTARSTESTLGNIGEVLHIDSHEATIKKYFLMKRGDRVNSETLADTERLLRRTPFILDARIEILAVAGTDSVDILVITRDRWSLGFEPRVKTARRYDFDLEERNVVGLGHQLKVNFDVDLDLSQTVGYTGTYSSDNVQGTFIRADYRYRDSSFEHSHRVQLARERLAPQISSIGALGLEWARLPPRDENESLETFTRSDVWLGRAFALGRSPLGGTSRAAITPALRMQRFDFHARPLVTPDENRGFRDRTLWLGSLSLNRSRFREGRLIRGYGRTEDVPHGFLVSVTGGTEFDEFETRPYAGATVRGATYTDRFGYLFGSAGFGVFRRSSEWEDTVLSLQTSYFSPLSAWRRIRFRQFLRIEYLRGTLRRTRNEIGVDGGVGLISVDANDQRGDQRLVATLESVTFAPFQVLGFRFASFGFLSAGTLGPDDGSLLSGRYTTTAGFGLRFHNERLIFNPIELRWSFLLNGTDGTTINSYRFGTVPSSDLAGFEPGAPTTVPFR